MLASGTASRTTSCNLLSPEEFVRRIEVDKRVKGRIKAVDLLFANIPHPDTGEDLQDRQAALRQELLDHCKECLGVYSVKWFQKPLQARDDHVLFGGEGGQIVEELMAEKWHVTGHYEALPLAHYRE